MDSPVLCIVPSSTDVQMLCLVFFHSFHRDCSSCECCHEQVHILDCDWTWKLRILWPSGLYLVF